MQDHKDIGSRAITDAIYRVVSIYLGIEFFFWGISNFSNDFDFDGRFGYPSWIQIPIGIAETAAGIGLMIPRANLASLIVLIAVMAGAVFSHLMAGDGGYPGPAKYLVYFLLMLYYRRDAIPRGFMT
ncbi:MAG: DoxX family protein [Rhodothermales bacterium]|nr:DoxX family protein [Rhodothermales bacterium]